MLPSFIGICHVGGGGGCPAYGTIVSWNYGVTYPIAEGGAEIAIYPDDITTYVPTQNCDVPVKADGACGTFVDWASATNIVNKPYGETFGEDSVGYNRGGGPSIEASVNCSNVGTYTVGTYHWAFKSNGSGSFYTENVLDYYPYGSTLGLSNPYTVNIACGDDTPIEVNLFWDGYGNLTY